MEHCFLELHSNPKFRLVRWWVEGTTKSWPAFDWELPEMSKKKLSEFLPFTPKNPIF